MSAASTTSAPESAAQAAAQARADELLRDGTLAQSKGNAPDQIEARKRVAALFCEIHLPGEDNAAREARFASIDFTCPVTVINARGIDPNAPRKGGLFSGFRRKPTLLMSARFPPKNPEDPVYALEYFVVKS